MSNIPRSRKITFTNSTTLDQTLVANNVVSRLQESILDNNFEEFKKIYETEYIHDPAICDYFNYEDENNNNWVNTYSLCICPNKETEPEHVHKNMNNRQCNCANGKRYLTYLCVFNVQLGCICYDTNPSIYNIKDKHTNTKFTSYLLQDGPIDLTYEQFYYEKK